MKFIDFLFSLQNCLGDSLRRHFRTDNEPSALIGKDTRRRARDSFVSGKVSLSLSGPLSPKGVTRSPSHSHPAYGPLTLARDSFVTVTPQRFAQR